MHLLVNNGCDFVTTRFIGQWIMSVSLGWPIESSFTNWCASGIPSMIMRREQKQCALILCGAKNFGEFVPPLDNGIVSIF
jgi:hypothetical protein